MVIFFIMKIKKVILLLVSIEFIYSAEISDIKLRFYEDDLFLSFRVDEAFTQKVIDRVRSGLETNFIYKIHISKDRNFWRDKVLIKKDIISTAKFDVIKKQYNLTRKIDNQIVESSFTDSEKEMRLWMTHISEVKISLLSVLKKESRYYLRVKGILLKRSLLKIVPSNLSTKWKRKDFIY
ncbi:MAG: DUF4390 domain-containing protein [Acidobacteriota bacterium]